MSYRDLMLHPVNLWLLILVLFSAVCLREIMGIVHVWGLHSISYDSHRHLWLRLLVLLALCLTPVWWWVHSGDYTGRF